MDLELTLQEVVDANMALNNIANSNRVELELQWKITDVIDALDKSTKRYGNEQRELLESNGTEIPDRPGQYNILPEKRQAYSDALEKLGKQKVNITFIPLLFTELKEQKVNMSGRDMVPLKKHFITRDDRKPEKEKPKSEPELGPVPEKELQPQQN